MTKQSQTAVWYEERIMTLEAEVDALMELLRREKVDNDRLRWLLLEEEYE